MRNAHVTLWDPTKGEFDRFFIEVSDDAVTLEKIREHAIAIYRTRQKVAPDFIVAYSVEIDMQRGFNTYIL